MYRSPYTTTSHPATDQEAFDAVVKHLATMPARCAGTFKDCFYRSGDNACAIGCLIPDDVYDRDMENYNPDELIEMNDTLQSMYGSLNTDTLQELQYIHDNDIRDDDFGDWIAIRELVLEVATDHNLSMVEVDKLLTTL